MALSNIKVRAISGGQGSFETLRGRNIAFPLPRGLRCLHDLIRLYGEVNCRRECHHGSQLEVVGSNFKSAPLSYADLGFPCVPMSLRAYASEVFRRLHYRHQYGRRFQWH